MLVSHGRFPQTWFPMTFQYSVLKSDGNLKQPQAVHCDTEFDYSFDGKKKFNFSVMIGFEEYSYLDIKTEYDEQPVRICLQRGDVFLFRGDIPHRGTENHCSQDHFRIHVYVDPKYTKSEQKNKSDSEETVKSDEVFPGPIHWDVGNKVWRNLLVSYEAHCENIE